MTKLFSDRNRPVHLGPYPLERLARTDAAPDLDRIPPMRRVSFHRRDAPHSIVNAMADYQAMLDAIRIGLVAKVRSVCPEDPQVRADHLKAFGYFSDASMAATCALTPSCLLPEPFRNPDVDRLADDLRTRQTKTLAAGIDLIMADLKESMEAPATTIGGHTHAIVYLYEYPRDVRPDEPGAAWIADAQAERACLRAAETAGVVANYLRVLGYDARAHSGASSDVDLGRLAVASGLVTVEDGILVNPYVGDRFGLAAVTTSFVVAPDRPLVPLARQRRMATHGPVTTCVRRHRRRRSGGRWAPSCCCRMAPWPPPSTPAQATRRAMPTRSRLPATSWASTPWGCRAARTGHGIRTTRPARRSPHRTATPSP